VRIRVTENTLLGGRRARTLKDRFNTRRSTLRTGPISIQGFRGRTRLWVDNDRKET
jgi:hypothetical protein